jgi:hypothetical protein
MTHSDDSAGRPPRGGASPSDAPFDHALSDDAAPVDAPLDAELRAAAAHYNRPPPDVPADAMWAAIEARRADARRGARGAREVGAPPALHLASRAAPGPRRAWRWTPAAAAAAALLGVGIGIGRRTAPDGRPPATPAVAPHLATGAPARLPLQVPATAGAAAPDHAGTLAIGTNAGGARGVALGSASARRVGAAAVERHRGAPASPVVSATAGGTIASAAPLPASAAEGGPAGGSAPLRVATEQHLARTEALLAAFAGGAGSDAPTAAEPDGAWARDLLTTTRLLLDSPAAREPARRALLEDLELVLGQIARLPRADTPDERALIDRAIRRGDLMAKLRTAVPAGAPAAARGT